MSYVRSLAVEPASVETTNWRSTKYKHWVNGFIIDGDYWLIKINKRTFMRTEEYIWNDVVPPFGVPVGEGIPTLVNPDNPFYIWIKKPGQWHPCWFKWDRLGLTIVDMVTDEVIGYGTPLQSDALLFSCYEDDRGDVWSAGRTIAYNFYKTTGLEVFNYRLPDKDTVIEKLKECQYWHSEAHGNSRSLDVDRQQEKVLYASEVAKALVNRAPYRFAFISSCDALSDVGPGTWAQAFTKNLQGHIVVGLKHVMQNTELWKYELLWKGTFYNLLESGMSIEEAFEVTMVSYPETLPIIDIFVGTSPVPEEFQNVVVVINPQGGGYTNPSSGFFSPGDLTITAYPAQGYEFDHWEVSGYWAGDNTSLNLIIDEWSIFSIVAYFRLAIVTYQLIIEYATNGGTTEPTMGSYSYQEGMLVRVTAYALPGYIFDYWQSGDGTKFYTETWEVPMTRDWRLAAYFKLTAIEEYTLTMEVSPSGGGYTTPAIGSHVYNEGTRVNVTAYPYSGYEFDYWLIKVGTQQITYPYSPASVEMDADKRLTAYFRPVGVAPPTTYALTVEVFPTGSGYTTPSVGTHIYDAGATVAFAAYPNPGYEFEGWYINIGKGPEAYLCPSGEVIINADTLLTALFKKSEVLPPVITCILRTSVSPAGSGKVSPAGAAYNLNYVATLTATPNPGYEFHHWDIDGTTSWTNPTQIVMLRDMHATAYFEGEAPVQPPAQFTPGQSKVSIVLMTNPTAKAFDYQGILYMGTDLAIMSEIPFHLEAAESKEVSFPVIMPGQTGTYPVHIGVSVAGKSIILHKAEDITITPATGMITLYGENFPVRGTDWNWYAAWYYAGAYRANIDDYYGWRGPNDACTPPEPIDLNNLLFYIQEGSYEYGYTARYFGPFVVEAGKTYTINWQTGELSKRD